MLDPSVGVYRIHGKAISDGIVGWATVAGNQGTEQRHWGEVGFMVAKCLVSWRCKGGFMVV